MTNLDCLVVAQPYASLIANGHKRWEFRSYEAKHTGKIGIAASHTMPWQTKSFDLNRISVGLPRGVVLATAELVDTFYVTSDDLKNNITEPSEITLIGQKLKTYGEPIGEPIEDVKIAIANKSWSSYAWVLENVQPLELPIMYVRSNTSTRTTWVKVEVP
jgi:hypothetical protein